MANVTFDSEDLREAAYGLQNAADLVRPRSFTGDAASLGSDVVAGALATATIKQSAKARKIAKEFASLATVLLESAESIEELDQDLAESVGG